MTSQPRIGAIVRCDATGLGIQSKEFFDHIPCKALVIDFSLVTKENKHVQNHHWYPGQKVFFIRDELKIPMDVISDFIKDIDVLIAFETPYDYKVFEMCRARQVKTILQINYEFLEYPSKFNHAMPDLFLAPSTWHYEKIHEPKMFLPVPVNTLPFTPQRKEKTFVHIAGTPATEDRNGTQTFLQCLQYVKNDITAIVRSQKVIAAATPPPNVNLVFDFENKPHYYDNYDGGVMVMPRKYGGLCLPCNEALAAEMPVIMPDISPNNLWLPGEWLVAAKKKFSFSVKQEIDLYEPDLQALAAKMDEFCEPDFYDAAIAKAKVIKEKISWQRLGPAYHAIFTLMAVWNDYKVKPPTIYSVTMDHEIKIANTIAFDER